MPTKGNPAAAFVPDAFTPGNNSTLSKPKAQPQICQTCRWFEPEPRKGTADDLGECRQSTPTSSDGWPKVYPNDWCGSWASMHFDPVGRLTRRLDHKIRETE